MEGTKPRHRVDLAGEVGTIGAQPGHRPVLVELEHALFGQHCEHRRAPDAVQLRERHQEVPAEAPRIVVVLQIAQLDLELVLGGDGYVWAERAAQPAVTVVEDPALRPYVRAEARPRVQVSLECVGRVVGEHHAAVAELRREVGTDLGRREIRVSAEEQQVDIAPLSLIAPGDRAEKAYAVEPWQRRHEVVADGACLVLETGAHYPD